MKIKCNLIVDLNYILMRAVFTLSKSNVLYGNLHRALENSVMNYRKWFPFDKVYLVSDSKEKSWRKLIYDKYKGNRKRDNSIDWEFVYYTYDEFKKYIATKKFKILESPGIEGDDWIAYITQTTNIQGYSNIIVSNDHDIKQLLKYDINDDYINLMTNEIYNKTKLFIPENYQVFINKLRKSNMNDIFSLTKNPEFLSLISNFIDNNEVVEINPIESLLLKIISGDTSDNIDSVWITYNSNGKKRGIGEKGAETIIEKYIEDYGEPELSDPNLNNNLVDLVMEKRKVELKYTEDILNNINLNKKLVNLELSNIPNEVLSKMENLFNSL